MRSYIENVENDEKGIGTGIYIYNDSKNQRYLYLNQDFLDDGRGFGDIDQNGRKFDQHLPERHFYF